MAGPVVVLPGAGRAARRKRKIAETQMFVSGLESISSGLLQFEQSRRQAKKEEMEKLVTAVGMFDNPNDAPGPARNELAKVLFGSIEGFELDEGGFVKFSQSAASRVKEAAAKYKQDTYEKAEAGDPAAADRVAVYEGLVDPAPHPSEVERQKTKDAIDMAVDESTIMKNDAIAYLNAVRAREIGNPDEASGFVLGKKGSARPRPVLRTIAVAEGQDIIPITGGKGLNKDEFSHRTLEKYMEVQKDLSTEYLNLANANKAIMAGNNLGEVASDLVKHLGPLLEVVKNENLSDATRAASRKAVVSIIEAVLRDYRRQGVDALALDLDDFVQSGRAWGEPGITKGARAKLKEALNAAQKNVAATELATDQGLIPPEPGTPGSLPHDPPAKPTAMEDALQLALAYVRSPGSMSMEEAKRSMKIELLQKHPDVAAGAQDVNAIVDTAMTEALQYVTNFRPVTDTLAP